jgi:uncharacterized protein (TIGR02217 family)
MAFDEVQFPVDISYGTKGGPGFKTDIITVDSGAEQRISRWSTARRQYDVAYGIKTFTQLRNVLEFYLARQGAAKGFRFKDFTDFTTNNDNVSAPTNVDCTLGVGDGATLTFQLRKSYSDGVVTVYRNISKPVASTTVVAKDGVNQASGWSIDTTTGIVTFSSAPANGVVVSAGCQFDVPVRFGSAIDTLLDISIDTFDTGSLQNIPVIELRDEIPVLDDFFYGGAFEIAISALYQMVANNGRVQVFNPSTSGLIVRLPNFANIPTGSPLFYLFNEGSNDITIKDSTGATTVGTLTAGKGAEIALSLTSDNTTKIWYML